MLHSIFEFYSSTKMSVDYCKIVTALRSYKKFAFCPFITIKLQLKTGYTFYISIQALERLNSRLFLENCAKYVGNHILCNK